MSTSTVYPPPVPYSADPFHPVRVVEGVFTALFVLVGAAIALSIVVPIVRSGAFPTDWITSSWIAPLVGLLVTLVVLSIILRVVFWVASGLPADRRYDYRHDLRHDYRHGGPFSWFGYDSAVETARQRYARGELTREQYDQLVRDLAAPHAP